MKQNTITARRPAPEIKEGEVLVRPGTLADAAHILPRMQVVSSLRSIQDKERQLEAEIATRAAELEAARQAAVEVQDRFEALVSQRNDLRSAIALCEGDLLTCRQRMAEIKAGLESQWYQRPTVDELGEYYRRQMMAEWHPEWIAARKARLAVVEAEMSKMAKEHDLVIPE